MSTKTMKTLPCGAQVAEWRDFADGHQELRRDLHLHRFVLVLSRENSSGQTFLLLLGAFTHQKCTLEALRIGVPGQWLG